MTEEEKKPTRKKKLAKNYWVIKKSGKKQHKSVNDHEQQTNLLRADCKFVDMH